MILYLSSTKHTNLLDFMEDYESDGVLIKKMIGNFVLKQFVIYDMRNFSHFTEVVLDRLAFGDTDEEFAHAIEEFLTMYSARVTVICEGLSKRDFLFQALLDRGVGNIVCGTEILVIQQEIRECLSDRGMTRYSFKKCQDKQEGDEKLNFHCKNVKVAVVGSQPRMGTTTTAIGLCVWLVRMGASVYYVEANKSGHLAALVRGYDMELETDGWKFEGVHYRRESPKEDTNFIVYDMGSSYSNQRERLEGADLRLLVCGTKPHELSFTIYLQRLLAGTYAYLFCPFVVDSMKGELAEVLQNDYHKVLFSEYQPELTNSDSNAKQFKTVIANYIMEE